MRLYWLSRKAGTSGSMAYRRAPCSSNFGRGADQVVMGRYVFALIAVLLLPIMPVGAEPPYTHPPEARVAIVPSGPSYVGAPQESYQLFVFGDSLAAGLFAGMSRMAEGDLRLVIDGRFKDDSGLT